MYSVNPNRRNDMEIVDIVKHICRQLEDIQVREDAGTDQSARQADFFLGKKSAYNEILERLFQATNKP